MARWLVAALAAGLPPAVVLHVEEAPGTQSGDKYYATATALTYGVRRFHVTSAADAATLAAAVEWSGFARSALYLHPPPFTKGTYHSRQEEALY